MQKKYPVSAELWTATQIQRSINPNTGLIEGDDSGYRDMLTLTGNLRTHLVVPSVLCRPAYDGMGALGDSDASLSLPGGLEKAKMVLREPAARVIDAIDAAIRTVTGGECGIVLLDAFRSWRRQAAGFARSTKPHLDAAGINPLNVGDKIAAFIDAGNKGDEVFSWVNADRRAPAYTALVARLEADGHTMEQIRAVAGGDAATPDAIQDTLYTYITVSANLRMGPAADVPLNFECNAHAGGGAADIMIVRRGKPLNLVPLDYQGPPSAMGYMEDDANYDVFRALLGRDQALRGWMSSIGFDPNDFSLDDWYELRNMQRLMYHAAKAAGCTYYSAGTDAGGENWHFEPGNVVYDPITGDVLHADHTASQYPDSGNPGHALQILGRGAYAVWGGADGHTLAVEHGLVL